MLNKIQCSCFTVKCIVVKSMKQYQGMTKEREFFLKISSKILKNMQHLEEVCNMTLVSQDNERIRAHKVVLASVSIPSGTCFRLMTRMHITNLSIYERSIGVKWGIYGERKKKCEDFM